jgi:methionyl-tRNA synthetase
MNRYIEEKAPWKLAKAGEMEELAGVLATCLEAVRVVSTLMTPVMPLAASALRRQIGLATEEQPAEAGAVRWEEGVEWGGLPAGLRLPPPQPLFPRIQKMDIEESDMAEIGPAPSPVELRYIGFDEFMRIDLRVADIVSAEAVSGANKLLKLTLKLGEETRVILAGIAEMYPPEELVGKQIVVVANLQPRTIRGLESQGMLLAADVDGQAIILQPETRVPSGSRVR